MLPDTRSSLHYGINFIIVPNPAIEQPRFLRFQQELALQKVTFQRASSKSRGFFLQADAPRALEVKVIQANPLVGQLLIVSPRPGSLLNEFIEYVEIICAAFRTVWPETQQVLSRDVTIRYLYESASDHAFGYLWETRLGQSKDGLGSLGRPVLGGGLRLVMPPPQGSAEATQVEVKIESFLRDSRMLFIETLFAWPQPVDVDTGFTPGALLRQVESFATNEVMNFVLGGTHG